MLDLTLLRALKNKADFNKMYSGLPLRALDMNTVSIIQDFQRYYETFETHESIDIDLLQTRLPMWHASWDSERVATHTAILNQVKVDIDAETKAGLISDLLEFSLATGLNTVLREYEDGKLETPLYQNMQQHIDTFKMRAGAKACAWNDTPIEQLLLEDADNTGVKWRLKCLNDAMRPLRPGDFGIIAGRPDKGKTTFIASEITYMASQLPEDRNIIWLNNEGPSSKIRKRIFQAAIGKTISEMIQMSQEGTLVNEYIATVGRLDKIRVFDIHDYGMGQVDVLLEQSNPGIIVYDMLDNIRGRSADQRTDLQLETMYQWARERSVKYSCIGMATSQISADGDGLAYPPMTFLKDSRTGKQGACDFIMMIGSSNEESLRHARYISVPKNKLRRDDGPSDPRTEVVFKPRVARYVDVE